MTRVHEFSFFRFVENNTAQMGALLAVGNHLAAREMKKDGRIVGARVSEEVCFTFGESVDRDDWRLSPWSRPFESTFAGK